QRAIERFAEAERRFPTSEWAGRAKKARGDLLLGHGHPFAARKLFGELAQSGDPLTRSAGQEGQADAMSWLLRAAAVVVALGYLALFALLQVRGVRPRRKLAQAP